VIGLRVWGLGNWICESRVVRRWRSMLVDQEQGLLEGLWPLNFKDFWCLRNISYLISNIWKITRNWKLILRVIYYFYWVKIETFYIMWFFVFSDRQTLGNGHNLWLGIWKSAWWTTSVCISLVIQPLINVSFIDRKILNELIDNLNDLTCVCHQESYFEIEIKNTKIK